MLTSNTLTFDTMAPKVRPWSAAGAAACAHAVREAVACGALEGMHVELEGSLLTLDWEGPLLDQLTALLKWAWRTDPELSAIEGGLGLFATVSGGTRETRQVATSGILRTFFQHPRVQPVVWALDEDADARLGIHLEPGAAPMPTRDRTLRRLWRHGAPRDEVKLPGWVSPGETVDPKHAWIDAFAPSYLALFAPLACHYAYHPLAHAWTLILPHVCDLEVFLDRAACGPWGWREASVATTADAAMRAHALWGEAVIGVQAQTLRRTKRNKQLITTKRLVSRDLGRARRMAWAELHLPTRLAETSSRTRLVPSLVRSQLATRWLHGAETLEGPAHVTPSELVDWFTKRRRPGESPHTCWRRTLHEELEALDERTLADATLPEARHIDPLDSHTLQTHLWQAAGELASRIGISRNTIYSRLGRDLPEYVHYETRACFTPAHGRQHQEYRIRPGWRPDALTREDIQLLLARADEATTAPEGSPREHHNPGVHLWQAAGELASRIGINRSTIYSRINGALPQYAHYEKRTCLMPLHGHQTFEYRVRPGWGPHALTRQDLSPLIAPSTSARRGRGDEGDPVI